ncbi:MAG: hypothetical protein DMG79_14535 [Acidobacteria bacterium]|nr:MAG: hypothetical protein DMG79_14535 [Acidobacteriota bacterium]
MRSKRLRIQHGHRFRRGNSRRNNRREIRGFRRNGVYVFKGVPYGASTAGARRLMPPVKPEPWSGFA